MVAADRKGFSRWLAGNGWIGNLWALSFFVLSITTTILPRTDKASPFREVMRGYHYSIGMIVGILSLLVFIKWWQTRDQPVNASLSTRANRWSRSLALLTVAALMINPILGALSGWSDGHPIHFGPLPALPDLVGEDRAIWLFTGYFHAGIGFSSLLLTVVTLLTAVYFLFRYGKGLFSAFLPGFGLYTLLSMAASVYAATTFSSPEPGPRSVAIFLGVCALIWGLARLFKRWPGKTERGFTISNGIGVVAPVAAIAFMMLGLYGPYALFRVSPIAMGERVEAAEGVTSYDAPVITVQVTPETALERDVRAENFKWCGFCHSMTKGGKHLAGPNLYAIFGQPIGKVPNFTYTKNFAAHGTAGEVWTDERMDALVANPDAFAPGTTMVVSSGNVTDPERRKALINILKKETMGDAVEMVDSLDQDAPDKDALDKDAAP